MRIERLKIHNWRSIKDIDIEFNELMMFIGQNNCGKSNILYSLLFFFGQIKVGELDFNGESEELFVEIKFVDLDDNDKYQFKKYLNVDDSIIVRKQARRDGGFSYHGYIQNPDEDWLKEENISAYTTRDNARELPLYGLLPENGRITKDAFKSAQQTYIENNKESLSFTYELESANFLGLKSVAQGIFGEIYFIPAVKAASDELNVKGNALFNQLYVSVIQKLSEHNEQYKNAKKQVKDLVNKLNRLTEEGVENNERPSELTNLETRLQNELTHWNTSIEIEITPPDIDEVFRVGTNIWVDDGIRTDINRKGHGLQRTMIFALIRAYSQLLREEREREEQESTDESVELRNYGRRASKSTYFILEEPELYLHPQAQRELFSSLQELSRSQNQVILATHSSFFVDLDLYKSICTVRKENNTLGSQIIQNTNDIFTAYNDKQTFNMVYWINPERSELFFATKVLLVEGATDKTVIPYLAKELEVFKHDYTIIDCAGKSSMHLYIRLLNNFKISYVAIYDKDHQSGKTAQAIQSADSQSQIIEAEIDSNFGKSVIFENDIEEEIGLAAGNKNKPFVAIEEVSKTTYSIPSRFEQKLKEIYQ